MKKRTVRLRSHRCTRRLAAQFQHEGSDTRLAIDVSGTTAIEAAIAVEEEETTRRKMDATVVNFIVCFDREVAVGSRWGGRETRKPYISSQGHSAVYQKTERRYQRVIIIRLKSKLTRVKLFLVRRREKSRVGTGTESLLLLLSEPLTMRSRLLDCGVVKNTALSTYTIMIKGTFRCMRLSRNEVFSL